jgi:capsular exopolysaccharide synthesis family protein
MTNVANSLTAEVRGARAQELLLQQQMERLRVTVSGENSAQVGLQALQTKARATRTIYESFLTRATQLANVSGIQEPDASLVSGARPPIGPSAPRTVRLVAIAGMLSLVLGVAFACVIERLRSGFSQPEQLEAGLGLPVLALVPTVSRAARRSVGRGLAPRRSGGRAWISFVSALDKLRGQMRALGDARPKLVMVTSALPQEGKSVFAVGLARNAAAAGWRVLLIECDFGCPSLAGHFRLKPGAGLCEILSGDLLGDDSTVIHRPEPQLHVITRGGNKGDAQELLASNRMSALLLAVRARYDLIVLDTPPVLPVADALVLARQVDATLMVVRWERTACIAAQDAVRLLRESRANIIGAVMTRVDARTAAKAGGRIALAFNGYASYHAVRVGRH